MTTMCVFIPLNLLHFILSAEIGKLLVNLNTYINKSLESSNIRVLAMNYGSHNVSPLKLLWCEPSRGRRQWWGQLSSMEHTWQVTKTCWCFFFHLQEQRNETSQSHPEAAICSKVSGNFHVQYIHKITRKDTRKKDKLLVWHCYLILQVICMSVITDNITLLYQLYHYYTQWTKWRTECK
jgi:hypothetical protein